MQEMMGCAGPCLCVCGTSCGGSRPVVPHDGRRHAQATLCHTRAVLQVTGRSGGAAGACCAPSSCSLHNEAGQRLAPCHLHA